MPSLAVDLGSSNIRVQAGEGRLFEEPAAVALDLHTNRIIAVGGLARRLGGRSASHIVQVAPVCHGVVARHEVTAALLRHYLQRALGWRRHLRPLVVLPVPGRSTSVERRAVREAATRAGAREALLVEAPVAAALGADLDIDAPSGHLIVHVGASGADVAVLSMGHVVACGRCATGGRALDQAIACHLERGRGLTVDGAVAERLKIELGSASAEAAPDPAWLDVPTRAPGTGLPRIERVTADAVREALQEGLVDLVDTVLAVTERVTPELAADLAERGMVVTGGGARLRGLGPFLSRATGLPARIADDPATCVLRGALRARRWMRRPRTLPLVRRSTPWQPA